MMIDDDVPLDSEMRAIMYEAVMQFESRRDEHEDIEWMRDEARDHLYKAHDELSQARQYMEPDAYGPSDVVEVMTHFANAFNHMCMALDIMHVRAGLANWRES